MSVVWASYQIRKIAGCACAGNAGNVFPRRRFQRKPLVSDPGMHHGTCVTHVPWCMSGSLTCGDGENVWLAGGLETFMSFIHWIFVIVLWPMSMGVVMDCAIIIFYWNLLTQRNLITLTNIGNKLPHVDTGSLSMVFLSGTERKHFTIVIDDF